MNPVEPSVLKALGQYAAAFEHQTPEILERFHTAAPSGAAHKASAETSAEVSAQGFPFEAGSDKGLGILLLSAAVYKPGGESAAARLILGLYLRLQNDVFRLNRIPFEKLRDEVEALHVIADSAERARIPGILRSVCDFFYRVGPLGAWLESANDWETRVMELCGEIYWMGRHSEMKNKARYFLWLAARARATTPAGGFAQARDFAWPVGEGHLRFYIDFLRPRGALRGSVPSGLEPARRLKIFRELAHQVFPGASHKLFAPLDAYLRRGGALEYQCRTVQGGCRPCPLAARCPASAQFIEKEGKGSPALS